MRMQSQRYFNFSFKEIKVYLTGLKGSMVIYSVSLVQTSYILFFLLESESSSQTFHLHMLYIWPLLLYIYKAFRKKCDIY